MSLRDGWSDWAGMMYDGQPWCARIWRVSKKLFAKYMSPDVHFDAVYVWQVNDSQFTICVYISFVLDFLVRSIFNI